MAKNNPKKAVAGEGYRLLAVVAGYDCEEKLRIKD